VLYEAMIEVEKSTTKTQLGRQKDICIGPEQAALWTYFVIIGIPTAENAKQIIVIPKRTTSIPNRRSSSSRRTLPFSFID
jgi:hypothetical protein